ncbi:hypothetical protein DL768_007741 [Monosporascus sp. mg162]|nr:hypothetical protein DL768_007741 [Monosporascus sp. mg162]
MSENRAGRSVLPSKRSTFQVGEKVGDAATTKVVDHEDLPPGRPRANDIISDVDRDRAKHAAATLPHKYVKEQMAVLQAALRMLQRRGARLRAGLSSP